jgi:hypothetical protein
MARAPRSWAKSTAALRQCPADAALPEPRAGEHAGHRPHAVVGLVLGATLPGDAGGAQQGPRRRSVARPRTNPGARHRGTRPVRWSCPTQDGRSRSARAVGTRVLRSETSRRTPGAAACTAGTGTDSPGPANRRSPAGPPSSPRWRARRRSPAHLPSCARLCRSGDSLRTFFGADRPSARASPAP